MVTCIVCVYLSIATYADFVEAGLHWEPWSGRSRAMGARLRRHIVWLRADLGWTMLQEVAISMVLEETEEVWKSYPWSQWCRGVTAIMQWNAGDRGEERGRNGRAKHSAASRGGVWWPATCQRGGQR